MLITKKRRFKPLYKKFLNLKQNVQSRPRLLNFKKRKWKRLIEFLERSKKFKQTAKFKLYDYHRYPAQTFSFKNNFRHKLHTKQKISYFYGGLSKKYIKSIIQTAQNRQKLQKKTPNPKTFFLEILEKRLDTVLYRSHFATSMRNARQLISHNHVLVNKKLVSKSNFLLQKGDLIEVDTKLHKLIEINVKSRAAWPMPPKSLLINYRTLQISFIEDISFTNLFPHFPFWLDLHTLMKYYER